MKAKRILFWSHLVSGVSVGLVVFILSLTGVLLTYERQIIDLAERSFYVDPTFAGSPLDIDALALAARESSPSSRDLSLVIKHNDRAAATIQKGRNGQLLMNPYTTEILGEGAIKTRAFFHWITNFHRWFALDGDGRSIGKAITGASNLLFLFIILSGLYIWLPKIWKWPFFRMNLVFKRNLPNAKARDYNWHHVLGIWSLIPLFFIITTGSVFSYNWASNFVYQVYGEQAPVRGGPRDGGATTSRTSATVPQNTELLSLQSLYDIATEYDPDWNRISMSLAPTNLPTAQFTVDTGTGGQPTKTTTLTISRADGSMTNTRNFSSLSAGQATRAYIRRLHTGESLGFIGQTIAGLASLAACFLVYTGLALAYRRLLQPLFKKPG